MKRVTLAAFGLFMAALFTSGLGCELITTVDRSKIDTGGAAGTAGTAGTAASAGTAGTGGTAGSAGTAGSMTSGGSAGSAGGMPCMTAADCGDTPSECTDNTCDNGMCGTAPKAAGMPAGVQTDSDCKASQCDGQGNVVMANDDTDVPDDGNECTADVCTAGVPTNPVLTAGTVCMSDGGSMCDGAGKCVECLAPSDCPGQDTECQARTCDAGVCGMNNAMQGAPVASQTAGDCKKNQCNGNGGVEAIADDMDVQDDGNDCTLNSCSGGMKVTEDVAIDTPCGAGGALKCNGAGSCVGCNNPGQCAPPGNECLVATCVAGSCGTDNKPDGTTCSDGDQCSQTDTCQSGACTGGDPVICGALDQCHDAGTCDSGTGICSDPSKADGVACNDSNGCTQTDTCQGGACMGADPVTCMAQDQCHDPGTCTQVTGVCSNPSKADGTVCSDGNACTQTDTCQTGTCTGMSPVMCMAQDQCHAIGTCDMATGVCSNPSKADGSGCNDGDGCTQTDTCQSGSCTGMNPVMCMAQDECHLAGMCSSATGMCSNPNAPNGTSCTTGGMPGACTGGVCASFNCSNGTQDGLETAIDCGGGGCPACANGLACNVNGDCLSNICNGGTCVECLTAAQCPGMDTDCQVRACNANACGFTSTASGTPTAMQTAGDCQESQCNGMGGVMSVAKDSDVPADDGNQCTGETCMAGVPSHPALALDTACNQNGGTVCNAVGSCVACNNAGQCPGSDTECHVRTCNGAGACGASNTAAGVITAAQTTGDCKQNQCDGLGGIMAVDFNSDVPADDGSQCTSETCVAGVPTHPALAVDTACNQNGGVVCNSTGTCTQPIFVLRVGDGSAALTGVSTAGFIEERDLAGALMVKPGNPLALPTAVNGLNQPLTFGGSANSEAALSRSANGTYVTFAGYGVAPGTAGVSTSVSGTVNRVVGRVDRSFNIDTTTRLDAAFSGSNVRAATSFDGSAFWVTGNSSVAGGAGVHYVTLGALGSLQVLAAPNNARVVHIFDNQLYGSAGAVGFTNVFTVGSGLPTMAGAVAVPLPGMPTMTASPYSFVLFDLNAGVAGLDTLYVADDRTLPTGGIQKWTFDGTTWTLAKTLNSGLANPVRGLAGFKSSGTNVTLIATTTATSANSLVVVVDDGSASPAFTTIATAPTNTVFRGVALAPN